MTLYTCSFNTSIVNMGHVVRMEEGRGVYKVLVGKPEGKR